MIVRMASSLHCSFQHKIKCHSERESNEYVRAYVEENAYCCRETSGLHIKACSTGIEKSTVEIYEGVELRTSSMVENMTEALLCSFNCDASILAFSTSRNSQHPVFTKLLS